MADNRDAELYNGDLSALVPVLRESKKIPGSLSQTDGDVDASPNIMEQVDESEDNIEISGSGNIIHDNQETPVGSPVNNTETNVVEETSNSSQTTQNTTTEPPANHSGATDENEEGENGPHVQQEDATEPLVRNKDTDETKENDGTILTTQSTTNDSSASGNQGTGISPEEHHSVSVPVINEADGSSSVGCTISKPEADTGHENR